MIRVLDKNVPVKVELNVETKFYDESQPNGFNTIADIPGTDLASEIVLLGAHFDSHPYATGATDNATGSGGDDGSAADSEGGRRQAASNDPRRRCGAARSRGCSARAPTSANMSPTSTRWR